MIVTHDALLQFSRDDAAENSVVVVNLDQIGHQPQKTFLGSFLEHLGHSMVGGVSAELLVNPTFSREPNLSTKQVEELVSNGYALVRLYLADGDPKALLQGWTPQIMPTGFGMSLLDDATKQKIPLGWNPLGYPGAVSASLGRLGGAARLAGGEWSTNPDQRWAILEDGPAGIRQGVFLPIRRCLDYGGDLWVRIATINPDAHGEIEMGFRRRVAKPTASRLVGECLASIRIAIGGGEWLKLPFNLTLTESQVDFGEPVDFYLRWLPRSQPDLYLLIDQVMLFPADAVAGLDPEIITLSREWPVPLLRWPGGNFVSFYHWRDGVGPMDFRPTYPNHAWGGLEYNLFGTDEFMEFCCEVGAEPHITVNTGTGTAEEAAAWVEYCNGEATTPMGRLRSANGHPEPYNVVLWEIGNELFGAWQGGFCGADENARRTAEFASAMRHASPLPIKLIACGNSFDFAQPGPGYDHTHADGRWHTQLLKQAANAIDYISLHSMPVNDLFLEGLNDVDASAAVLAQVTSWERKFLPELLAASDEAAREQGTNPIQLAISEWGCIGGHPFRLHIENFGGVIYGGLFLNMMIRNAERIPIANTTGFMHGGCLRKAFGITYFDPQYLVIQQYAPFIGLTPVACTLTGPGFDVPQPADVGAKETGVSFLDVIACKIDAENSVTRLRLAVANRHMTQPLSLVIRVPALRLPEHVKVTVLAYPEISARTTPADPNRFGIKASEIAPVDNTISVELPPFSVTWIEI